MKLDAAGITVPKTTPAIASVFLIFINYILKIKEVQIKINIVLIV